MICRYVQRAGLVPETYPVGAVVVSDVGMRGIDSQFAGDVVVKVLLGSGKNSPLLILPVSDNTMEKIKGRIESLAIPKEQKEKYKKSLLQVKSQGFTWQQDYMQPFVNPQTGQIQLREVQGYLRQGDSSKI